jgi:hypothetical protein
LKISIFVLSMGRLLRSRIVAYSMPAKALHSLNRSALPRMTGSDEAGIAIENRRACLLYSMDLLHLVTAAVAFLGTIIKRWHHKQMAHVLWQPRCLEVASRRHHVEGVDETRRTYRHDGRQRDAPWRIATFHHATLRVATHRYATLEPLGKPGGSRAFSADGPPQSPGAPRRLPQPAGG